MIRSYYSYLAMRLEREGRGVVLVMDDRQVLGTFVFFWLETIRELNL